jgi:uncharacterized membrane protein
MLNKITLVSCLLFFLFGSPIFAHSQTAAPDTEAVMKEEATEINNTTSENPSMMNYVFPAIMGLIIVLGFGSYWLIFRRKQI